MDNKCKRMTVTCVGMDREGNIERVTNYNKGECTGEEGNCGCVHAEIALLERMPRPLAVVISHSPCINCAKELFLSGVERVWYLNEYRKTEGIEYLEQMGIHIAKADHGL